MPRPVLRQIASRHASIPTLLFALALSLTATACAGWSDGSYMRGEIERTGQFDLILEPDVTPNGIEGQVLIHGCVEYHFGNDAADPNAWDDDDDYSVTYSPLYTIKKPSDIKHSNTLGAKGDSYTDCLRFPRKGVLVRVVAGGVEIQRRTDDDGRFIIASGAELERLQSAAPQAEVIANLDGREVRQRLSFAMLDGVVALRLLDEMKSPTTAELAAFIIKFRGTDAAELALARHGQNACHAFRSQWNTMMAGADLHRIEAINTTFDATWQEAFCAHCAAECRAIRGLDDLSAELGALTR